MLKVLAFSLASAVSMSFAAPAWAEYPDRPLTLIVAWGAGGGTDAVARIVAAGLERELGQPVAVVNRTGGSGVVGYTALTTAEPDGYTIGLGEVGIGMMHWQGLTDIDWQSFTPLALVNEDAAGLHVSESSGYPDMAALVEAIKNSEPGTFRATGAGQGSIWHLALAGMLVSEEIELSKVVWVPNDGAAAGLQDLMAGGVDIVTCSMPEARSLIEAGRVKSLSVMGQDRSKLFPEVPTLAESVESDWTMGAWRGMLAPKGLPDDITARLIEALQVVYEGAEFQEFMNGRGFGTSWAAGDEFAAYMEASDHSLGETLKAVGLAK